MMIYQINYNKLNIYIICYVSAQNVSVNTKQLPLMHTQLLTFYCDH